MRMKFCRTDIVGRIPGHQPAEVETLKEALYVGLFRDPRRRLISAFNYGRHWCDGNMGVRCPQRGAVKAATPMPCTLPSASSR